VFLGAAWCAVAAGIAALVLFRAAPTRAATVSPWPTSTI
jgi:hypothetical protein